MTNLSSTNADQCDIHVALAWSRAGTNWLSLVSRSSAWWWTTGSRRCQSTAITCWTGWRGTRPGALQASSPQATLTSIHSYRYAKIGFLNAIINDLDLSYHWFTWNL